MIRFSVVAFVAIATVAACAGETDENRGVVVRDSGGVRIVENATAASELAVWTLAGQPRFQLGTVEGDLAEQFFRVSGAVRLSDGRIAVANAGSQELRLFTPGGRHLRSVGGRGGGPGEYRGMRGLWRFTGDSLLIHDGLQDRLTLYTSDGVLARSWQMTPPGGFYTPPPIGRLANGDYIAEAAATEGGPLGPVTYTTVLVRYSAQGQPRDTVATASGGQGYWAECDPGGTMVCNVALPFALTSATAVGEHRIYLGNGETYEIRVFTAANGLTNIWRWNVQIREVTSEDVRRYREHQLEAAGDENARRRIERWYLEMPLPDVMPMYSAFLLDSGENLWVEDYRPPFQSPIWYTVFDSSGTVVARITIPLGLDITDVGSDYVLAVWKDELDVEYVQLYDLIKP